jgi:hypothetical protein
MLQPNGARISAAPPQSAQPFVYTVRAGARACVTPITTNCGDCGGSQAFLYLLRPLQLRPVSSGSENGDEG